MPTQGEQLKALSHISSKLHPVRWKIQEEKLQKRTVSYSNQGTSQTNGPHKVITTNESKMSSFSIFFSISPTIHSTQLRKEIQHHKRIKGVKIQSFFFTFFLAISLMIYSTQLRMKTQHPKRNWATNCTHLRCPEMHQSISIRATTQIQDVQICVMMKES